ncbi:MAG TPA: glycoside hydrolase family 3 N-terminal domain-containing protein [Rubricoccaceae bacterium]|nr:glycoside hydrolase family 3 N-terminal domain-containing protein [Rubricoccaceae bacterium]
MPQSLREKVAGLVVARLGSNMIPPRTAEEDAAAVADLLDRHPIGGLILFNGRWPETRRTLLDLQARSDRGLLVMTDMERGLGQQVAGATVFPHLMAFGALGGGEEAQAAVRDFARMGGVEALACGVHVALAPVADVNRNPRNPIISTRAFGTETATVEALVRAYVEGAHDAGLLTTAKHFPGHGNTHEDSHAVLPAVDDAEEETRAFDLPPFAAAIDAGTDLVMTAHVRYAGLDPVRPATRSPRILRGLLRDEMGFEGVVITDSLHMGGIKDDEKTEAQLAIELLEAGVDLLLDLEDPEVVIEGVAQAVEDGRLSERVVDDALARAERLRETLRARFGPGVFRDPALAYPPDVVGHAEHHALAARVARHAVHRVDGRLPDLGDGAGTLVVLVKPAPKPGEPEWLPLRDAVLRRFPRAQYRELEPFGEEEDAPFEALLVEAREAERIVVAVIVRPAAWHRFGLAARERRFVQQLLQLKPSVLAALGSPRGLDGYEGADARLCLYSDVPASQDALADVLAERDV